MKNMFKKLACFIFAFLTLSSCSFLNERSAYEGVRASQKAKSSGSGTEQKNLPPYDQYEKERNAIRK
jgi:hypothetical protein